MTNALADSERIPVGLCVFSFGYLTGGLGRRTDRANPNPLDAYGLMQLALKHGLSGVEFPARMVGDGSEAALTEARAELERRDLTVVADGGRVIGGDFPTWLKDASSIGAKTLRVVLSGILCGDRRPMDGKWNEHVDESIRALKEAEPVARDLGVAIAVENHQDADSDDLVRICETVDSDFVGVNLDAGNPLAVGEDPVEFADKIAPFLKNVHLKEYLMAPSDTGYRLIRCPVGAGVVDWRTLFALFDEKAPNATRNIELGAMSERHIELFEDWWWKQFPSRDVRTILGPMRLLATRGSLPDADYRTPWQRDEPPEAQLAYERRQFERSVEYLRRLIKESPA